MLPHVIRVRVRVGVDVLATSLLKPFRKFTHPYSEARTVCLCHFTYEWDVADHCFVSSEGCAFQNDSEVRNLTAKHPLDMRAANIITGMQSIT